LEAALENDPMIAPAKSAYWLGNNQPVIPACAGMTRDIFRFIATIVDAYPRSKTGEMYE
jgi:hypothetical protein